MSLFDDIMSKLSNLSKTFDNAMKNLDNEFNSILGNNTNPQQNAVNIQNKIPKYARDIDYTTFEGIRNIHRNIIYPPNTDYKERAEYVLQRKATQYKKNGQMDLAIACLRKSNDLMPFSPIGFSEKDYMRLVKYLRLDGQNEEADREEREIKALLQHLSLKRSKQLIKEVMSNCKRYNDDLIILKTRKSCPICSAYDGKIFSVFGTSRKYPKAPDILLTNGQFECGCSVAILHYFEGITK